MTMPLGGRFPQKSLPGSGCPVGSLPFSRPVGPDTIWSRLPCSQVRDVEMVQLGVRLEAAESQGCKLWVDV